MGEGDPAGITLNMLNGYDYFSFIPEKNFKIILNGREYLSVFSPWRVIQFIGLLFSGRKKMVSVQLPPWIVKIIKIF